jgi:hypothetical protein
MRVTEPVIDIRPAERLRHEAADDVCTDEFGLSGGFLGSADIFAITGVIGHHASCKARQSAANDAAHW